MARISVRLAVLALMLALTVPPGRAAELRDVVGATHAAGKYSFSEEDFLNEGADRLLELGTRVIKIWFQLDAARPYPFHSEWGTPPTDLAGLARKPYYRELFAKPFTTFILVVPHAVPFTDGVTPEEAETERERIYKLARYLLEQYAGSGKTFIIQNWEGDHLFRQGLDGAEPDPVRIQGMRDWWNARQDGVDQARREVGMRGVVVAHAAEVNHLADSMDGKVTATNAVVPFTHADLYSYSSWDLRFDRRRLVDALEYLKAMAPDSELYGEDNIYLGEFGAVRDQVGPGVKLGDLIQGLTDAAVGWGVRYAVFWQLYCNEAVHPYEGRPRASDLRGFWLVRPDGVLAASWRDLKRRMIQSRRMTRLRIATGQLFGTGDGDAAVIADRWRPLPSTRFALIDLNGEPLRSGDPVAIQARDGFYLDVREEGGVFASADDTGKTGVFRIWKAGSAGNNTGTIRRDDDVALQAPSGRYLTAEPGSGRITATGSMIGPAETFRLLLIPE
ncbi:MAG: hypothetical protein ABUT39_16565 [Acidobacteriota bacterium]